MTSQINPAQTPAFNRGLHRIAILLAVATAVLIFMGGLVTSYEAGLAVPDWPDSLDHNMFLLPPSMWQGGVFYEHTHRLMGSLVGMIAIALVAWAWATRTRKSLRILSLAILAAVILQGVLGGLRVIWINLDLAIVHACVAQAFFCLTALNVAMSSRWWALHTQQAIVPHTPGAPLARGIVTMAALLTAVIFIQLIVAATMRHHKAGLAIPDFPTAYDGLLPPTDAATLDRINAWRATQHDLNYQTVTMGQVWIHFTHRILAVLIVILAAELAIRLFRRFRHLHLLVRPTLILAALIVTQFTLGIATILLRRHPEVASLHVVGALCLFTAFTIATRAIRLRGLGQLQELPSPQPLPSPAMA